MKSNEFKTLVQIGQIVFKNGSSINCHLLTHKNEEAEEMQLTLFDYDDN